MLPLMSWPFGRCGQLKIALLVGVLAAAGCATAPEKPKLIELMWPEPPLTPRIKFVRTLASESDLERKPSLNELILEAVVGKKPAPGHLREPMKIAVSDDGQRVYVADYGQGLVYRFDLERKELNLLGVDQQFERPFGLAIDAAENLYVVEQGAKRIRVLNRQGKEVRRFSDPSLERPTDIAIDRRSGRLYVADPARKDSAEHTVKVFDLTGTLVGKIGKDKGGCEGCLYFPTYLTIDREGRLYVTSTMNARVDVFDLDGKYLRRFGERGSAFGMFDKPKGVALDSFGNLYVVDSGWSNVQIFNQKGSVLLFFGGRGAYPGLLKNPTGIAIDGKNRIYVADYLNYRVSVYELVNTTAEDSFLAPPAAEKEGGETAKTKGTAFTEKPSPEKKGR
jgi:DNA-binding beta-propeller fold protein YncE